MLSAKNLLQEYYQKAKQPLPIYTADSSGPPHQPTWIARVAVADGTVVSGFPKTSRVKAELSAAEEACNVLKFHNKIRESKSDLQRALPSEGVGWGKTESFKTYGTDEQSLSFLVDLETASSEVEVLLKGGVLETQISSFARMKLPEATKADHVIPSSRSEAVDLAIAMALMRWLDEDQGAKFVIITRNTFGVTIAEISELFYTGRVRSYETAADYLSRSGPEE